MSSAYLLYLESGPQRKKTLAHVLDLLGCVVQGDTTDQAIAAAPDAIRAYLRYLARHGEKVDQPTKIETAVAEHNTGGMFSGQALWPQDLKPLTPSALARYVRWLEWSRADLLALVKGIDDKALRAKPSKGRSLRDILLHVLDADKSYVYGLVGPLKTMGEPTNAADRGDLDLHVGLQEARAAAIARLKKLTPEERARIRKAGQSTYSAYRVIRRMLEHEWEHRAEIAARLGREA
ncbi:MAG TPA: DinB family protein [Candidatus Polarisedimenticolia bacterium]|nr:DinB family protein [Candidatus Polarisedimenticolia bacterium]